MEATLTPTISHRLWPRTRIADATLIVGGSLCVAALAQLRIPLPFTPVPTTGQTLAVLLLGATLGSRRGALAMLLYLVEGLAGLPFFAGGGSGIAVLAGPTGGYLLGFVPAAWVVGRLAERGLDRRFAPALAAFVAGECVIYAAGLPWLATFVGVQGVLAAGLWPFLGGDVLKAALAAAALPVTWRAVEAWQRDSDTDPETR